MWCIIPCHDDVSRWEYFPCYWPFVQGIHWSPVNSPHKGQWCGALRFSLTCAWINGWINNCEAGDLRGHLLAHYDITVMLGFILAIHHWCHPLVISVLGIIFNTLRLRQNGRHFKTAISNAFSWMKAFEFWLIFPELHGGQIHNIPALV